MSSIEKPISIRKPNRAVPNAVENTINAVVKAFMDPISVSYTHLRAHETEADLVCRLLLEKKKSA